MTSSLKVTQVSISNYFASNLSILNRVVHSILISSALRTVFLNILPMFGGFITISEDWTTGWNWGSICRAAILFVFLQFWRKAFLWQLNSDVTFETGRSFLVWFCNLALIGLPVGLMQSFSFVKSDAVYCVWGCHSRSLQQLCRRLSDWQQTLFSTKCIYESSI